MDTRENYEEINALVGAIGKALDMEAEVVAKGLEDGTVALSMAEDENGNRYVEARHGDRRAQVYQGAVRHAPESEETTGDTAEVATDVAPGDDG